jgi:dihydrofolate reductase
LKKIIISAVAQNGVIGRSNGEIPWHVKEEFQHFKNTTFGSPVIMGRKTFEPMGKPLKGRLNVIITSNRDYVLPFDEVKIFHSLKKSIEFFEKQKLEKIFIIGGAEIYKQAMEFADEMIISFMPFEAEGDIYFPKIDENIWAVKSSEKRERFEIVSYVRK